MWLEATCVYMPDCLSGVRESALPERVEERFSSCPLIAAKRVERRIYNRGYV